MRSSELFVLAAKLVAIAGIDYKNHPDINEHERDAIANGFRELNFFQPGFADKLKEGQLVIRSQGESLETRPERKPGRPPKGI